MLPRAPGKDRIWAFTSALELHKYIQRSMVSMGKLKNRKEARGGEVGMH